jgi:hypothetical protein
MMKNIPSRTHDNSDNYRRLIGYYRRHLAEGVNAQLVIVYTREIAKMEAALRDVELMQGHKTAA